MRSGQIFQVISLGFFSGLLLGLGAVWWRSDRTRAASRKFVAEVELLQGRQSLEVTHPAGAAVSHEKRPGLEGALANLRRMPNLLEEREFPVVSGTSKTHPTGPESDDLQLIKGIGPVFETELNRLGFFRLEQIATLDESEIGRVAEALSIPSARIHRDDWVGQASHLLSLSEGDT